MWGFAPGIWDELAAGTSEADAPVGVMVHPDSIHRTAGYVTRMSGGGREAVRPLPIPINMTSNVDSLFRESVDCPCSFFRRRPSEERKPVIATVEPDENR